MKKIFFILIFNLTAAFAFSQVINNTQIFNSDHWVYDYMYKLGREEKLLGFYDNTMLSAGELKLYLNQLDYENLSPSGKKAYDEVYNLLYTNCNFIPKLKLFIEDEAFRFYINLIANPEFYYKSNEAIDWSFRYNLYDNFLTSPAIFALSDYISIETDPFFGKTNIGSSKPDNFMNIPYREDDAEFMFLKFSYGSCGLYFDKWGINLNISKQGYTIGKTRLGSIFYNKTFESDAFLQMNIFSKAFKYSGNIVQVDYSKYLFLHEIAFILFNNFKLSVLEGSMLCNLAELRFTIPFMFMHQFSAWNDYSNDSDNSPYGEEKFCAYFGIKLEWTPVKNSRIYLIFAQNELQTKGERESYIGDLYPDSLGLQLGAEYSIPTNNLAYWNFYLEGIYTSPYLYIKHTPLASLYRTRQDNLSSDFINSWVGCPYGPDVLGGHFTFEYEKLGKWKAGFTYNLIAKGEHDFSIFNQTSTLNQGENNPNGYADGDYTGYYPPTAYNLGKKTYEEALADAHNMLPSGIVQYTNQLILGGEYQLNKHIKFRGQALYALVLNCGHLQDNFQQGLELTISMTYNLF